MAVDVQQITGTSYPIARLLGNSRYGLDFYQREYSWEEMQVGELIDDLATRFLDEFDPIHERRHVATYRPYFLGPIVTAQRDGVRYLVDGQQRVTTLSLLLIHLRGLLAESDPAAAEDLNSLIFSTAYGEKTFNLDVPEREACLTAILEGREFDPRNEPESVRNLWNRHATIVDRFPDDLQGDALPYFVDWLQNRVILVDIGAPDQDMALEIFETMNDRGLRLGNTDMLKSYLLARVGDEETIRSLNERWRQRVVELTDIDKNADAEFAKAWLRGDYAETQRERKANASPGDFDIIGTAFHKWVRDNAGRVGLEKESDYRRFVEEEFLGLSKRYAQLLRASQAMQPGLEAVYYNARNGFTFQLPVILAAITSGDSEDVFREKTALVAGALDIFVVRRMVNFRNFGYSTVSYTMFNLMKQLRDRPTSEIGGVLAKWLQDEDEKLYGIANFYLTKRNRKHIHYLLARMTAWLDVELGNEATFIDYIDRSRTHPFEVEHIWANHFDRHLEEFDTVHAFEEHRDKLGDLVLLPKDFNASYGDMPYLDKVQHYFGQNSLARSLHPKTYTNNPSFLRVCSEHSLPFTSYPEAFTPGDIEERQALYRCIAEIIWDPAGLGLRV